MAPESTRRVRPAENRMDTVPNVAGAGQSGESPEGGPDGGPCVGMSGLPLVYGDSPCLPTVPQIDAAGEPSRLGRPRRQGGGVPERRTCPDRRVMCADRRTGATAAP